MLAIVEDILFSSSGSGKGRASIESKGVEIEIPKIGGRIRSGLSRFPFFKSDVRKSISLLPVRTDNELVEYLRKFIRSLIEAQTETIGYTPEKPIRKRKNKYVFEKRITLPASDIVLRKDFLKLALIIDISGSMSSYVTNIVHFVRKLVFSFANLNIKTNISTFLLLAGRMYILLFNSITRRAGTLVINYENETERRNFGVSRLSVDIINLIYDASLRTFTQVDDIRRIPPTTASGLAEILLKDYNIFSNFGIDEIELQRSYMDYENLFFDVVYNSPFGGSIFTNSYKVIYNIHKQVDYDFMIEMTDLEIDIAPPENIENEFCKLHAEVPFIIFTKRTLYQTQDSMGIGLRLLTETIIRNNLKEPDNYVIGNLRGLSCTEKII